MPRIAVGLGAEVRGQASVSLEVGAEKTLPGEGGIADAEMEDSVDIALVAAAEGNVAFVVDIGTIVVGSAERMAALVFPSVDDSMPGSQLEVSYLAASAYKAGHVVEEAFARRVYPRDGSWCPRRGSVCLTALSTCATGGKETCGCMCLLFSALEADP